MFDFPLYLYTESHYYERVTINPLVSLSSYLYTENYFNLEIVKKLEFRVHVGLVFNTTGYIHERHSKNEVTALRTVRSR